MSWNEELTPKSPPKRVRLQRAPLSTNPLQSPMKISKWIPQQKPIHHFLPLLQMYRIRFEVKNSNRMLVIPSRTWCFWMKWFLPFSVVYRSVLEENSWSCPRACTKRHIPAPFWIAPMCSWEIYMNCISYNSQLIKLDPLLWFLLPLAQ